MEMRVHEENKIVEIWLTNAEKNNPELKEKLKKVCNKFKQEKYLVAMYESGKEDLYQKTMDLLHYNKRRIAELEVQKEKAERGR